MGETRQQRRARERAEAKAESQGKPPPLPPLVDRDLMEGITLRSGATARLATSVADSDAMAPLVAATGYPLDSGIARHIGEGALGGALLAGLRSGWESLARAIAESIANESQAEGGGQSSFAMSASLPIVAETGSDGIVGALYAIPPLNITDPYVDRAPSDEERRRIVLSCAISVAKVPAVGVAESARGQGIASDLVLLAERVYRQCGFRLLYGQMPQGRHLEGFYSRLGFDVLHPSDGLDLWLVFGTPGGIKAHPGEQLFAKWL